MSTASSQMSRSDPPRQQASQAQRTAEAEKAFSQTLRNVGSNIDAEMRFRAENIHAMDKSLTKQEKDLQKETKKLAKQTDEMQKFVDKSKKQLANLEDIGALNADLESDLQDIEELLSMVEEDGEQHEITR